MKLAAKSLMLMLAVAASLSAQNPPIQHVIIVIQENRTPENLFNQDAALAANGGYVQPPNNRGNCHGTPIPLQPADISGYCATTNGGVFDPDHSHLPSWINMWDKGAMDGACDNNPHITGSCTNLPTCSGGQWPHCAAYTYVNNTQNMNYHPNNYLLDPYFNIAANYVIFSECAWPPKPTHRGFHGS
jgi:hypothetical protein